MNIDDLREDIADLEEDGELELANELSMLAYAWEEEEEDLDLAVAKFLINYIDYPLPNFIAADIEWDKVSIYLEELDQ